MRVTIDSVRQVRSLERGRIGQPATYVAYQVEGRGADYIEIPLANATRAQIDEAIKAKVAGAHEAEGGTIEV